jgi:OPA family sugar phosphate sensor protein UhpC-like MFS transporter
VFPLNLLRTREDQPRIQDPAAVRRRYRALQYQTFFGITFGYSFFYVCRLSLSVAKQPMIDGGVVDADELGLIGSALLFSYAFGRLTNGFLADRAHIGRLMFCGLAVSALLNLLFGGSGSLVLFAALWGINGWFQSMGSAPSGANLSHWFSNRERGTRYSIWSISHSLGEGITFYVTAAIVQAWGWRAGFLAPGVACLGVALLVLRLVKDRPQTYGLPPVAEYRDDHGDVKTDAGASIWSMQRMVLRNLNVWVLGLASACLYVARYGVSNWMVLYLQKHKGNTLLQAGSSLTLLTAANVLGSLSAGPTSDRLFAARRPPAMLLYGSLLVAGLSAVLLIPPGNPWLDRLALAACGFAIGGQLVFLGGLTAIDICPKRAAGAAMGVIGLFSYLGAAIQDLVSGLLIEAGRSSAADGSAAFNFDGAFHFWIGAAAVSLLLCVSLWRVKVVD